MCIPRTESEGMYKGNILHPLRVWPADRVAFGALVIVRCLSLITSSHCRDQRGLKTVTVRDFPPLCQIVLFMYYYYS